jgi:hypothetical protein
LASNKSDGLPSASIARYSAIPSAADFCAYALALAQAAMSSAIPAFEKFIVLSPR